MKQTRQAVQAVKQSIFLDVHGPDPQGILDLQPRPHLIHLKIFCYINGQEATINRALDDSTYPSKKLVHSVFGKINYGGLKHNSLYLGLVYCHLVGDRASLISDTSI